MKKYYVVFLNGDLATLAQYREYLQFQEDDNNKSILLNETEIEKDEIEELLKTNLVYEHDLKTDTFKEL